MKKSHQKLLIFESLILIILLLNSFIWNILETYSKIIFLLIITIILKKLLGLEKDKHRYLKDILFDTIIFLLIYFLLYYLFGLIIGFAKTDNYYTLTNIFKFIIPTILTIIIKEFLRYSMIMKSEGNKFLLITTCILFIFFDLTTAIYYTNFQTKYESFIFIALTLLPTISTNISCSYITYKIGYKPPTFYLLITSLYQYLLPIIPNPNEYLAAIINFLLPIFYAFKINNFFNKETDEYIDRNYGKQHFSSLIIPTLIIIVLVYFTSGYFHYYAVAIASGSMEPKISKGDIVIIEQIEEKYEELVVGQVIAYKYNGIIVVHRLVNIIEENGKYYFYTKGDANTQQDNYPIEENMILGKVNVKIPYIGYPTVWLNEL